jgi:hypothetical protein
LVDKLDDLPRKEGDQQPTALSRLNDKIEIGAHQPGQSLKCSELSITDERFTVDRALQYYHRKMDGVAKSLRLAYAEDTIRE